MYDLLKRYLKDKNEYLGKEMFSAVLLDLQFREAGNTTRASNLMAYAIKLFSPAEGLKIDEKKFERLSKISSEVWKTK
ncbi:hypothetical protein LL14B4_10275 [Lactococcus lactis subsp. lactis]|uniref:Uncharacterized protein n=1 Tax=Lactococcus lactis subsp. lactis TaxID=1360 RepID=A0A2Z3KGE6_LACLL|nr:hypothetical protein [Lactococcus lactis]AWN66538.1 hypothetical protein LL14B4_10275 [Lactococcus lactis subsp. lactis]